MQKLLTWLLLMLLAATANARGLRFAEEMHGYGYWEGEFRKMHVSLVVTIHDIDRWRIDRNHPASVAGTLYMDRLPEQPVTGTLAILAPGPNQDGRLLTYRLSSNVLQFTGIKHVQDQAGVEVFDDMTTLHGLFQTAGVSPPKIEDLLYRAQWTSAVQFAWWDPVVVWNFTASFETINTPWYDVLEVYAIFVGTMFGALAETLFPWL